MERPRDVAAGGLPSREQLRTFIKGAVGRVGRREVSREFGVGPELRRPLQALLGDLAREGANAVEEDSGSTQPAGLMDAVVVRVTGTDPDGEPLARPVEWSAGGSPPLVLMAPERRGNPALALGERVLARLRPISAGRFEGRTIRRLSDAPGRVLGVFRAPNRLTPTDRRAKAEWRVPAGQDGGAADGEVVLATPLGDLGLGLKPARIIERLGRLGDARSVSLICIHGHGIPTTFPEDAVAEAAVAHGVALDQREDLRSTPLITIDGEDARDFDDAVYAEPDGDGHRLIVAIADVAHYVRPGSALDQVARERGNSVYFPDRVVPMLPETLSTGWCSLRPAEDRGCLFVEMRIDATGRKTAHRFGRGLMRSAARLTYAEVQDAADAGLELGLGGLLASLYAAFRALLGARAERGALDLDLPERRVTLDEAGRVASVSLRPRLDSHRLVEEFMVLANVAAAEELERRRLPCMYRVHAPPSDARLNALRSLLEGLGIGLPPGNQVHPRSLSRALCAVAGTDQAAMVNEAVLRSQLQAAYNPHNIGHFGLGLARYAHFTSPIRRYADLLVHRALTGGMASSEAAHLLDTAQHITATERRAALAEREAVDRYAVVALAEKTGACFPACISGVTKSGAFVTLVDSGASGLMPLSGLPGDFWTLDEATQSLRTRRSGHSLRLGQKVEVRLVEASAITGRLLFQLSDGDPARDGDREDRRLDQR